MEQDKIQQLNAANTTVSYCESTAAHTAGIAAFAPLVATIKSKIVIVHSFNILAATPATGITVDVNAVRESMEQHTYKLASATFSFAAAQSPPDNDLMAQAKFSKGRLERLNKSAVADECDRIQQLAAARAAGILPYGAAASDITDAAAVILLYRAATDDRREAQVSHSGANRQAADTLKNIMNNLLTKQLDSMANTLRYSDNDWWKAYRAARQIIYAGAFTTVLKIRVLNSVTSLPVVGAKVYRDDSELFKKTSRLGFVTFKDIGQGNHNFVAKRKRFNDLPVNAIMISYGEKKTVSVMMIPILRSLP